MESAATKGSLAKRRLRTATSVSEAATVERIGATTDR